MKKLFSLRPSDKWTARIFLTAIALYCAWTGYIILSKHAEIPINPLLLIMLVPVFLVDGIKIGLESFSPKKYINGHEDISKVSVIVPSYNGEKVIGRTLDDLVKRFPLDQIIISSNGSKDGTCQLARDYGVRLLEIPEAIGKVEAINRALFMVKTPYVVILDDDTLIGDAIIPTSILDDGQAGVAFRVYPVKQGFWTELQGHEYRKSMDVGRRFHNHSSTVTNISGAIGLFRTSELIRQKIAHTGEFSGEDLQRTLLVHLARKEGTGGVVMSESVVETLAPNDFSTLFKQRVYGWYPGFLANFHLYMKLLLKKDVPLRLRYDAIFNCFLMTLFDPIRLLALPILLFHPVYLAFFYIVYICLETVPWVAMGRVEPFWVVLCFPFYGIFNFITRMLAMSVFLYRRIAKYVGRGEKNDDYKFVNFGARTISVMLSSVVSLIAVSIYAIILLLTTNYAYIIEPQTNDPVVQAIQQYSYEIQTSKLIKPLSGNIVGGQLYLFSNH